MTAQETMKETSALMVEFMYRAEQEMGRRLTPEEARSKQFKGDARAYAVMIMRWRKKKGKPNGHN